MPPSPGGGAVPAAVRHDRGCAVHGGVGVRPAAGGPLLLHADPAAVQVHARRQAGGGGAGHSGAGMGLAKTNH